jgi:DNA-binding response OmpR family regulator
VRILLVEDDIRLADALMITLRRRGFEVFHAATAAAALAAPAADVVLLDLGLPDQDGIELCRAFRARSDAGIIAVTARKSEPDRIGGFRAGADDYVVKPFSVAELHARIEAVFRRARPRPAGVVTVGSVSIDLDARKVHRPEGPVALTQKEFRLLAVLAREPGTVVNRDRLLMEVWGSTWQGGHRTLDVHVVHLRAKLAEPGAIETVWGVGYRLGTPQREQPVDDGGRN